VSIAGLTCLAGTLFLTPLATRLGSGPALVLVLAARGLAILPLVFAGLGSAAGGLLMAELMRHRADSASASAAPGGT
jgi:hypothetical protein